MEDEGGGERGGRCRGGVASSDLLCTGRGDTDDRGRLLFGEREGCEVR